MTLQYIPLLRPPDILRAGAFRFRGRMKQRPNLNSREDFLYWLEREPPHHIAGRPGNTRGCALARWLIAQGAESPVVTVNEYTYDGEEWRDLPIWARRVVAWFDEEQTVTSNALLARMLALSS
jgi:hypothetical protein